MWNDFPLIQYLSSSSEVEHTHTAYTHWRRGDEGGCGPGSVPAVPMLLHSALGQVSLSFTKGEMKTQKEQFVHRHLFRNSLKPERWVCWQPRAGPGRDFSPGAHW